MAETFEALGLRDELRDAVATAGYDAPTSLQREAIPMLRRGGNLVILASAGAGVVAAYGLGLLDRVAGADDAGGPAVLVLQPTPDAAAAVALSLARFAAAVDLRVAVPGPGWRDAGSADAVVTTPDDAAAALRASTLKLESLQAVVLDGADRMLELGMAEALETLLGAVPREAQRVVTGVPSGALDDLVERHVRRAVRVPPQPADEEAVEAPTPAPRPLRYALVSDAERPATLATLLNGCTGGARVFARARSAAESLARELSLRGYPARADEDAVEVDAAGDAGETCVISAAAPFDETSLRERHGERGGYALIGTRELPHLRRIAAAAGVRLDPLPDREPAPGLESFREKVRRALEQEDVDAQLLVLAPLFDEAPAARVAAALAALLRRRAAPPAGAAPASAPERRAGPTPPPPPALTRLFISVGQRDRIGPGDLVGSITGEAQVRGEQVGKIEIRDNFSIVEVETEIADKVIRALNGTTIRGRSVRVDYDRRGSAAPGRPPRRPRPGPRRRTPE